MDLTTEQRLPYPSSEREAANLPLVTELLGRATDTKLATIDAAWAAARYPTTQILRLTVPLSGVAANSTYILDMDTNERTVGCGMDTGAHSINADAACGYGWYHVMMSFLYTASGTADAGSRRRLVASVEQSVPGSSPLVVEQFLNEDYQPSVGSESSNGMTFVTQLLKGRTIWLYFDHGNTSSTLTVASGVVAVTQFLPVV